MIFQIRADGFYMLFLHIQNWITPAYGRSFT